MKEKKRFITNDGKKVSLETMSDDGFIDITLRSYGHYKIKIRYRYELYYNISDPEPGIVGNKYYIKECTMGYLDRIIIDSGESIDQYIIEQEPEIFGNVYENGYNFKGLVPGDIDIISIEKIE